MLFNDICNNLHKKNANYRKKCIFLVQNMFQGVCTTKIIEYYAKLTKIICFHKWLIFSLIYENSVIWRCFVR